MVKTCKCLAVYSGELQALCAFLALLVWVDGIHTSNSYNVQGFDVPVYFSS